MGSAAVFWDRDDTLIEDPGYLSDPDQVVLLPGAAEAIQRLAGAGFQNIVVTNQSGIARGLFDEETLERIHARLRERLAEQDAQLDAIYYCPYLAGEEAKIERYRRDSDLRKPKPGMLVKASLERGIDLVASWMVGNSLHDAQAGRKAGCRTVLIHPDAATKPPPTSSAVDFVVGSATEAAEIILKHTSGRGMCSESGAEPGMAGTLQEILSFLRMVDRRQQREDFSLARLTGAIMQILAVGALIWAIFGLLQDEITVGQQLVRLDVAIVLQLLTLTCFVAAGKR